MADASFILHHEGGLPRGDIVAGPHAGENLVDETYRGSFRRHERAGLRHQRDKGRSGGRRADFPLMFGPVIIIICVESGSSSTVFDI